MPKIIFFYKEKLGLFVQFGLLLLENVNQQIETFDFHNGFPVSCQHFFVLGFIPELC